MGQLRPSLLKNLYSAFLTIQINYPNGITEGQSTFPPSPIPLPFPPPSLFPLPSYPSLPPSIIYDSHLISNII